MTMEKLCLCLLLLGCAPDSSATKNGETGYLISPASGGPYMLGQSHVGSMCVNSFYMPLRLRANDLILSVTFSIGEALAAPPYPADDVTHWLSILSTESDTDVQVDGPSNRIAASPIGCGPGEVSVTYQDTFFKRGSMSVVFTND